MSRRYNKVSTFRTFTELLLADFSIIISVPFVVFTALSESWRPRRNTTTRCDFISFALGGKARLQY